MKTAIDTPILLDVLSADPKFGRSSRQALRRAYSQGALVVCSIAWAEICSCFPDPNVFRLAMQQLGARHSPISEAAAELAGSLWQKAHPRKFVFGFSHRRARAARGTDALLTRDRGLYATCFKDLKVIEPS